MRSRLAVVALALAVLGERTIAQNPTVRISGRRSIVLSATDLSSLPRGSSRRRTVAKPSRTKAFRFASCSIEWTYQSAMRYADLSSRRPLREYAAPFRLVLTGEKRPARWVRQVVSIEVVQVPR